MEGAEAVLILEMGKTDYNCNCQLHNFNYILGNYNSITFFRHVIVIGD